MDFHHSYFNHGDMQHDSPLPSGWKASESSEALLRMVTNTCHVKRSGCPDSEISITELVPGDVILLAAGDMIPADVRIIEAKDLFVSQSSLTGESDPIEKLPAATHTRKRCRPGKHLFHGLKRCKRCSQSRRLCHR